VLPLRSKDSKFVPFAANPALNALMKQCIPTDGEGMHRWLEGVELAIYHWIVHKCFIDCSDEAESIARCAAYRSLGRANSCFTSVGSHTRISRMRRQEIQSLEAKECQRPGT